LLSESHDELAGHWYVEALFGTLANSLSPQPAFKDLEAAQTWLNEMLCKTNSHSARSHRRQAAGQAISIRPVAGLDQVKNPNAPAATRGNRRMNPKLRRGPSRKTLPIVKRSIDVAGLKTSVSLETEFWDALKEIATALNIPVRKLVSTIKTGRKPGRNLSSAIRVFILEYYRH
jgi:predicted DNA-binding ribbon-helix-helix protein